jgi:hypothetical protein
VEEKKLELLTKAIYVLSLISHNTLSLRTRVMRSQKLVAGRVRSAWATALSVTTGRWGTTVRGARRGSVSRAGRTAGISKHASTAIGVTHVTAPSAKNTLLTLARGLELLQQAPD